MSTKDTSPNGDTEHVHVAADRALQKADHVRTLVDELHCSAFEDGGELNSERTGTLLDAVEELEELARRLDDRAE